MTGTPRNDRMGGWFGGKPTERGSSLRSCRRSGVASRRLRSRVSPALTASTAGAYRGRNDAYPQRMPKPRARAVVEWWSDEEGWGALAESAETPGGVFVHF